MSRQAPRLEQCGIEGEADEYARARADLELFDSPTEELSRLEVREVIGGYYRQVGVTWNGGATLARQDASGWRAATPRATGGARGRE